ncbi:M24 family metallopeptidase [Lacticaseibacillus daqingensis]|uniref:M24 family metallopeptidase n=1 Tax=Lacticaseibacillus daqingensis TaxID=2486014 RepID=UPI000F7A79F9|nr:aminopeptidase P family protein [Lacticaseibacillus daqingensis]
MNSSRLNALRQQMTAQSLDAFILSEKANRFYLTGFTGTYGQGVIAQDAQFIVADGRYFEQLKTQSPAFTVVDNQMRMVPTLQRLIQDQGFRRVGIEAEYMNVEEYLGLTAGAATLVPTTNVVESLRMIKSAAEQQAIQAAARVADETYRHILDFIRPGMTEKQVANEIDQYGLTHGADAPAFETIVASGVRSALPHGHASNKVIQAHELIIFDFGFLVDHYYSDITRTVALGSVSPALREIYAVTLEAQEAAIQACHAGTAMATIDQTARRVITDAGYGPYFLHGTGHGLGLTVHEYPLLNQDSQEALQAHMTFTVEPGIYLAGQGGVRIEDDVWLDDAGAPVLMTHAPKQLIEL